MKLPYTVDVHEDDVNGIGGLVAWAQLLHFHKAVHYCKDGLEPFVRG